MLSSFDDQEFQSNFTFKEREWPKKCTISFSIPAASFSTVAEEERGTPDTVFLYKGSFKVSLLNRRVVLMRGSVYKTSAKKRL